MFRSKSRLYLLVAFSLVSQLNLPAQADDEIALLGSRMAIAEALTQYPYRWDSKSTQSFAELFTEDAVMERWRRDALLTGKRDTISRILYFWNFLTEMPSQRTWP